MTHEGDKAMRLSPLDPSDFPQRISILKNPLRASDVNGDSSHLRGGSMRDEPSMRRNGSDSFNGNGESDTNHIVKPASIMNPIHEQDHDEHDELKIPVLSQGSSSQPAFLNDETIQTIRNFLKEDVVRDALDEDAITQRLVQTDQIAAERVRHLKGPCEDSDDDEVTRISQTYKEEEEYTLAQDIFKEILAESRASETYDKKTFSWLRKAIGLRRRNELWETTGRRHQPLFQDNSDDSDGSGQNAMRLTRGMARTSRMKRREERMDRENQELDALLDAVKDLEDKQILISQSSQKVRCLYGLDAVTKRLKEEYGKTSLKRKLRETYRQPLESPKRQKTDSLMKKIRSPKKSKIRSSIDTEETESEDSNEPSLFARLRHGWRGVKKQKMSLTQTGKMVKVKRILVEGKRVSREKKKHTQRPKSILASMRQKDTANGSRIPAKAKKSPFSKTGRPRLYIPLSHRPLPSIVSKKVKKKRKEPSTVIRKPPKPKVAPPKPPSTPISLSLLEWKRRQQWTPSREDKAMMQVEEKKDEEGVIKLPKNLGTSGIETDLPAWENINPYKDMTRQPPINDPARRRHSSKTYAKWCLKLVNCLNGSGRSWARHEFFYSDVDRAWFNFDQYAVELAKCGISPTARLTRTEWSVLRRQIRRKPRRFSRAFVKSQQKELEHYRDIVRKMQHANLARPPEMKFEVATPIKVGTTVTAYNRRFCVLHRGMVLAYDIKNSKYLVQFEKKELGFEFCKDTEVASHGVPELLDQATELALDGSTIGGFADFNGEQGSMHYGTCYQQHMNVWQESTTNDVKGVTPSSSLTETTTQPQPVSPSFTNGKVDMVKVNKVAEREAVIKLIEIIDNAMRRKTLLLKCIRKLSAVASEKEGELSMAPTNRRSSSFAAHYAWLLANLHTTSKSLESAMVHLQVMYGKGYSHAYNNFDKRDGRIEVVSSSLQPTCGRAHLPLAAAFETSATDLTSRICSVPSERNKVQTVRKDAGDSRAFDACRMMLALGHAPDESSIGAKRARAFESLKSVAEDLAMKLQPKIPDQLEVADRENEDDRLAALRGLREALQSYTAEVAWRTSEKS